LSGQGAKYTDKRGEIGRPGGFDAQGFLQTRVVKAEQRFFLSAWRTMAERPLRWEIKSPT